MNFFAAAFLFIASIGQSSSFVVTPHGASVVPSSTSSSSSLNMSLMDFFSEDARKAREAKKQAEVEEQMRLQAEIYARRKNPEMMEEYEAKVQERRALRMAGKDDEAAKITQFKGDVEKIY